MFSKISFDGIEKNKDFGYAANLDFFKENKEVEFKKGLNIIFAPNGSGKSTILSMLAIATACEQGGRSVVTEDWGYAHFSKSLEGVEVDHDGQPVMYANPRNTVGLISGAAFDDDFMSEGIFNSQNKESTGRTTTLRLANILSVLYGKSSFPKEIEFRLKEERLAPERKRVLEARIEKGQRSIIMDEPESGLAIQAQSNLFDIIDKAAKEQDLQIIIATHSIFSLTCTDANFIELSKGYINISKSYVYDAFLKMMK